MAGYDWSKGKSNNAVWAEEEGMRTKSKITAKWLREGGITEKVGFVKFLIKADRIMATECTTPASILTKLLTTPQKILLSS